MLIIGLATIDDVRRLLKSGETLLYLSGLGAVCAVNYIVFSLLTLYYIGYPLLIAYLYYTFRFYLRKSSETYFVVIAVYAFTEKEDVHNVRQ